MAFWKKSEDPWDQDPSKRRSAAAAPGPAEREPGLLDRLKDWNEGRKAEKAREETLPAPIPCPWCGRDMEVWYIWNTRGGVYLSRSRPGLLSSGLAVGNRDLLDQGNPLVAPYKTVWCCENCGRLTAELPPERETLAFPAQAGEEQEEGE